MKEGIHPYLLNGSFSWIEHPYSPLIKRRKLLNSLSCLTPRRVKPSIFSISVTYVRRRDLPCRQQATSDCDFRASLWGATFIFFSRQAHSFLFLSLPQMKLEFCHRKASVKGSVNVAFQPFTPYTMLGPPVLSMSLMSSFLLALIVSTELRKSVHQVIKRPFFNLLPFLSIDSHPSKL